MRMWLCGFAVCLRGGCIRLLCSSMRQRMRMRQDAAGCGRMQFRAQYRT